MRSRLFDRIAITIATTLLVAQCSWAQTILPVSRLLHCEATAGDFGGTTSHFPPDVAVGAVTGSVNHSATATSPQGFGRGSASLSTIVTSNSIDLVAGASGTILGGFPPVTGGGSASGQIVVDVAQSTWIAHDLMTFSGSGGFTIFRLKIQAQSGPVLLDRTYAPGTDFNDNLIFFPADRYTFTGSASDFIHIAGSSGGTMLNTFTVVPEPASALALVSLAGAVAHTRRRLRK